MFPGDLSPSWRCCAPAAYSASISILFLVCLRFSMSRRHCYCLISICLFVWRLLLYDHPLFHYGVSLDWDILTMHEGVGKAHYFDFLEARCIRSGWNEDVGKVDNIERSPSREGFENEIISTGKPYDSSLYTLQTRWSKHRSHHFVSSTVLPFPSRASDIAYALHLNDSLSDVACRFTIRCYASILAHRVLRH